MFRWLLCKIGIHKHHRIGGVQYDPSYPRFGACCGCGRIHPENRR